MKGLILEAVGALPSRLRHRSAIVVVGTAAFVVGLVVALQPFALGLFLVVRAADFRGPLRWLADLDTVREAERVIRVAASPSMRGRLYEPLGAPRQAVLLVAGVHPGGIDEPRLVSLSRELAKANILVLTPEIPELSRFEITPVITDRIEQAALWLAAESGLAPTGKIGMMGVSFSGGLSVVAAGRPSLRNRLLYVFSFGGHDDLMRVLNYYCTGVVPCGPDEVTPSGSMVSRSPHDYGLAIVLLGVIDHLVPHEQAPALRDGVRRFLTASYTDRFDKAQAQQEFAALAEVARTLPQPSATLLALVNNRDVVGLGPYLLPYLREYAEAPALSPSRSPGPSVPVFLLHGLEDNVIPAIETRYLANRLRASVPVRMLMTDLISHADADRPARLGEVLRLAGFWGDLLTR